VDETTLLLLRHGHTAANDHGRDVPMSGWTDVPLSASGLVEADALAERVAREAPPAAVYSSPLLRARHTAEALGRRLGLPVELRADLREIHCGTVDGVPIREVQRRFPREWARNERQEDAEFRWPGGESYAEFRARCLAALDAIARAHPSGRVAVVTHAGLVSQVVGWLGGLSPARWHQGRPGNASISELAWSARGARLLRFDDTLHVRLRREA
jgi:broad specificity phosphatase PhoE